MLSAALLLAAGPAMAGDWQFVATPYFMIPTMDGKAAVGPLDVQVSTSPSDIFSHLNWGAMGQFEVTNGKWGFNLDATYMNLDATSDTRRYAVNGHQGAYTGTILYRVHPNAEVYVGARVNDIGTKLDCNFGCRPGIDISHAERSKTWVDPVIGVRAVLPFSDTVDLTAIADFGGFGVGSDVAVQFWPSLGFKAGPGKAMLGYRIIHTKYQDGTGLNRFVYDVTTFGPTLGYQIRF
jgi:hypothetical protein